MSGVVMTPVNIIRAITQAFAPCCRLVNTAQTDNSKWRLRCPRRGSRVGVLAGAIRSFAWSACGTGADARPVARR
jgi:hypothetical protein